MRWLIFFILGCAYSLGKGQNSNLQKIRVEFKQGVQNKEICVNNLEILEETADSPVEKGYLAAYQIFMAKHISNPFKKIHQFKVGKNALEELISKHPKDPELRYIRLCIQYYAPKLLGYSSNIEEDKDFVMHNLYKIEDSQTKQLIYRYLEGAKMYSSEELALLNR